MPTELDNLYRLSKKDADNASEVAARAFFNDPVLVFYLPNEDQRREKAKFILKFEILYAILFGEVYATSENLEAIAGWRSPQNVYISPERQIECGAKDLINIFGRDFFERVAPIDNYILDVHKKHAPFPHWFLSPIVVDPIYQGKGYASKLLRPMIERIGSEQLPIYLSTNVEKNSSMYKHFGFKIVEELVLPNTTIKHWSMLREP